MDGWMTSLAEEFLTRYIIITVTGEAEAQEV